MEKVSYKQGFIITIQVGPLSQAIRAAKISVHLTSLYHTALTSTNDHLSVLRHYVCT